MNQPVPSRAREPLIGRACRIGGAFESPTEAARFNELRPRSFRADLSAECPVEFEVHAGALTWMVFSGMVLTVAGPMSWST